MKPPERFPKTNGLLRLGLTGPSARTSAEASRLCGLKLASRRVGHQTSSRDAANETCPCRRYARRRGCSKLPPRRRRDARRREWFESTITPSPRLNRPRRPNAIDATRSSRRRLCLNTSSGRGRFDGAGVSLRERRRRSGDPALRAPPTRVAPVAAPRPVRAAPWVGRGSTP